MLFLVVATHVRTPVQMWRLSGVIVSGGAAVAGYGMLRYFALNPFSAHTGGVRVISSLGNPAFAGAFMLMGVPLALIPALIHRPNQQLPWLFPSLGLAALTVLFLGMVLAQARGPLLGLAAGLIAFLAMVLAYWVGAPPAGPW